MVLKRYFESPYYLEFQTYDCVFSGFFSLKFCHLCQIFNFPALLKRAAQIGTWPGGSSVLGRTSFASAMLCPESFPHRDFKSKPLFCSLCHSSESVGQKGDPGALASCPAGPRGAGGASRGRKVHPMFRVRDAVGHEQGPVVVLLSEFYKWLNYLGRCSQKALTFFLVLEPTLFSLLLYFICH